MASTTSFPAPHTRVLSGIGPAIVLQLPLKSRRRTLVGDTSAAAREHGAEERFEAVAMWLGTQEAASVDDGSGKRRRCVTSIDQREPGRALEKGEHDPVVFVGLARAGGVDEASTWRDDICRSLQHRQGRGRERGQIVL